MPNAAPLTGRRWPALTAGAFAALLGLLALGESQGWSFLAPHAQRWLSSRLDRPVTLGNEEGQGVELHLWGGIRLSVAQLHIGSPAWSTLGPLLEGSDVRLSLRWRDALAWRPGRALPLQTLAANRIDLRLQRLTDGRANWTLTPPGSTATHAPARALADLLTVQQLDVAAGHLQFQDAALGLHLDGQFNQGGGASALRAEASGSYRGQAVRMTLRTGTPRGFLASAQAITGPVPMTLSVQAGRASFGFQGMVRNLLNQLALSGRYQVSGLSLATVGEPLGITLPQTRRFALTGRISHAGSRWYTVVDQASVGDSQLAGAFVLDRTDGQPPMLAGRLNGSALLLQDLGPALGGATETAPKPVRASGRVLPDRNFDLPSLRAMNADVLVALDKLDFGTPQLQAAAPVSGRVRLSDGVLTVDALKLTLAQGSLSGRVQLDGRRTLARWQFELSGRDLVIERWLRATQRKGEAPYASGRLSGDLALTGTGNSTAKLLASADGRLRLHWRDGQVSHLLVEAAGLDVAQGLGVLLTGDEPLPVNCGAADIQLRNGRATPQLLLVDTHDSVFWVDGHLSLLSEKMQLLAHVQPKDWSPLSLRAPLHIDGTLGAPVLSLDTPKLLQRALPAALLAFVNPLAALLPLMDLGDETGPRTAGCQALVRQFKLTRFDALRP